MDHLKALGIKFIVIAITVFSIFGIFYNATLVNMFWISLLVTGISYLIGDMFILRKFGNVAATIADFPLTFLSLWALGSLFIEGSLPMITLSLLGAFFITICEPFIHAYIDENFSFERHDLRTMNQIQTEFSEEIDPDTNKKEDK
ncbi:YndM family protein [Lentibacillus sp. Marseille-P4043]|uniref:YndM family protein n=1 Tax=Lentibacillus sp. Marseille-P4043 TaxID=2040293 RepID=UPI000D0B01DE|nr:YndM family protein [Lentibacillus sp. Marseille-P4043]